MQMDLCMYGVHVSGHVHVYSMSMSVQSTVHMYVSLYACCYPGLPSGPNHHHLQQFGCTCAQKLTQLGLSTVDFPHSRKGVGRVIVHPCEYTSPPSQSDVCNYASCV